MEEKFAEVAAIVYFCGKEEKHGAKIPENARRCTRHGHNGHCCVSLSRGSYAPDCLNRRGAGH